MTDNEIKKVTEQIQSVDAVFVETIKAWLYKIAMNNTNNYLCDACEEIISRLDGLRAFAKEGGITVDVKKKLELLEQLRNSPLMIMTKEPTVEVVQEWISVEEQEEPAEDGTYLCHGYWCGSRRKQTETAEFFGEWKIANNFVLTHWMPLPQPPKGE